jgi:hypothetical protein
LQDGGLIKPRTGKGSLTEVAHHTEHKTLGAFNGSQVLEAGPQIRAGFEVDGQSPHG